MPAILDLFGGEERPAQANVLAVLFIDGKKLYAVTTAMADAPWYGVTREESTALFSIENERSS